MGHSTHSTVEPPRFAKRFPTDGRNGPVDCTREMQRGRSRRAGKGARSSARNSVGPAVGGAGGAGGRGGGPRPAGVGLVPAAVPAAPPRVVVGAGTGRRGARRRFATRTVVGGTNIVGRQERRHERCWMAYHSRRLRRMCRRVRVQTIALQPQIHPGPPGGGQRFLSFQKRHPPGNYGWGSLFFWKHQFSPSGKIAAATIFAFMVKGQFIGWEHRFITNLGGSIPRGEGWVSSQKKWLGRTGLVKRGWSQEPDRVHPGGSKSGNLHLQNR